MSKKNKKIIPNATQISEDIFDVRKNLNKLRQGKPSFNSFTTETDNYSEQSYNQPLNSEKNNSLYSESYGSGFNETLYNKYDNLKFPFKVQI